MALQYQSESFWLDVIVLLVRWSANNLAMSQQMCYYKIGIQAIFIMFYINVLSENNGFQDTLCKRNKGRGKDENTTVETMAHLLS